MKIGYICRIAGDVFMYYMFGKRTPVTVSFLSTYSCNQKCRYCDWTKLDLLSMNTEQALSLIKDFKKSGVIKLGFAGGESLCREDIDILLECAHKEGLVTSISSNGREIYNHIDAIEKYIDVVQLSLDGSEKIHDGLRGDGSYQIVIDAIELLKSRNVKMITNTVVTKRNLNELEYVLHLAEKYEYKALFQSVFYYKISESSEAIRHIQPTYYEMYYAIEYLIKQKKYTKTVGNSTTFLEYVQKTWGKRVKVKCHANDLFCSVDPLGYVLPCCFDDQRMGDSNSIKLGFKQAFANSAKNDFADNCNGCYCNAYIETDLAFSFSPSACINALNIV